MKPEQFKPTQPNELTEEQVSAANTILNGRDFKISDYAPETRPDTEPAEFKMTSPWEEANSALDSQLGAAESILGGTKAKPVTPGKTDKFALPKIPVVADKKPELTRPPQINTTTPEIRLDQRYSPLEVERRRMQEREAQKNRGGLFNKIKGLFGGS